MKYCKLKSKTKINESVLFVIGLILLRLAFDASFAGFVVERYPQKFWYDGNIISQFFSWILMIITFFPLVILVKYQCNRFSVICTLFLYIFSYMPTITLCGAMFNDLLFTICLTSFWLVILLLLCINCKKKSRRKNAIIYQIKIDKNISRIFLYICSCLSILIALYIIYEYNSFNFNFSFDKIYELRKNAAHAFSTAQGLVLVIVPTIILPILIPITLHYKKHILFLFLSIVQIMLFMVGGDKFFLIILILGVFLYFIFKKELINYIPLIVGIVILTSVLFICLKKDTFFDKWIFDIAVRRMFFTPAMLSYKYFEFFQTNPILLLCDDPLLLRLGWTGPYGGAPIANIIGVYYWNETGANTGMFGNAFSEFGYFSILLYPIIYILTMKIIDMITADMNPKLFIILVLSISTYLLNGSIAGIEFTFILFTFTFYMFFRNGFYQLNEKPIKRITNKKYCRF